jgi:hypothetical protein
VRWPTSTTRGRIPSPRIERSEELGQTRVSVDADRKANAKAGVPPRDVEQVGLLPWGRAAAARRQNPLDILRGMMEADPQTVADVAWKAMKEGRDVLAITAMLDRTYGDETTHVDEQHTFDELAKLTREQRRALITQLEREGRGSPFRAPEQ